MVSSQLLWNGTDLLEQNSKMIGPLFRFLIQSDVVNA